MKKRNLIIRVLAVVAATSMMLSGITVYADGELDSAVEIIENTEVESEDGESCGDEIGSTEDNDISEVVELTVTIEEIAHESTDESVLTNTATFEVTQQTEESSYVEENIEDNIEAVSVDSTLHDNKNGEEKNDIEESVSTKDVINDNNNNGEKNTEQLNELEDSFDQTTGEFALELNYSKVLRDFSVSQSSTGRYNAEFVIVETDNLTGIKQYYKYVVSGFADDKSAEDYAEMMVDSYAYSCGYTQYVLAVNGLIDAEKIPMNEDDASNNLYADSSLCWAGSVADMLELSGWNKAEKLNKANSEDVSDEDKLFDLFAKYYTDKAGNQLYGLEWFFNGIYSKQDNEKYSHLKDNDGYTSPWLKEYCSGDFVRDYDNVTEDNFGETLKSLNADSDGDRCAIGIVFGYYKCDENGEIIYDEEGEMIRAGGHCVTIVGYSTDENGLPKTITIADSDTYFLEDESKEKATSRKDYLNVYTTYPVKYYDGNWHLMNYADDRYDNIIEDLITLKYYSENTKYKIEEDGTLDPEHDYDFFIYNNYLSYNNGVGHSLTVSQDDELFGYIFFKNRGLKKESLGEKPLTYSITISKEGKVVRTLNYSEKNMTEEELNACCFFEILMNSDNPLEEGEYTVSYILNYDRSIKEAYYNNNKSQIINKFVVIKRIDENGNADYVVVADTSSDDDDNNSNNDYKDMLTEFITYVNDYSKVVDKSVYENDKNAVFEFVLSNNRIPSNITDADLLNAEICFDYSVLGDMATTNGANITSQIVLTKNDYSIIKKADGSLSMVFSNEFMRMLPKGTHYFKLFIAGKPRFFKIVIK